VGPVGPNGTAGSAIAFDTDATVNSDSGSNSKSDFIRTLRGENYVQQNDIYWHVQSGRVFQYRGANHSGTSDLSFTELTSAGFINPEATIGGFLEEFPFSQTWTQTAQASNDGYIRTGSSPASYSTSLASDTFWIPATGSGVAKQPFFKGVVTVRFHNQGSTRDGVISISPQVQGFTGSETVVLLGSVSSTSVMFNDDDEGNTWRRIRVSGNQLRKVASGVGKVSKNATFNSNIFSINHAFYDAVNDRTEFQIRDDDGDFNGYTGNLYYQMITNTSSSAYNAAGAVSYASASTNGTSFDTTISVPFYCVLPATTSARGMRLLMVRAGNSGGSHYAQILSITGSTGVLK
jgi:hypothetical protein